MGHPSTCSAAQTAWLGGLRNLAEIHTHRLRDTDPVRLQHWLLRLRSASSFSQPAGVLRLLCLASRRLAAAPTALHDRPGVPAELLLEFLRGVRTLAGWMELDAGAAALGLRRQVLLTPHTEAWRRWAASGDRPRIVIQAVLRVLAWLQACDRCVRAPPCW